MYFSAIATIFGLAAVTIAAPGAPFQGSHDGGSPSHNPGINSVCFCCPGDENTPTAGTCSPLAEDNTCQPDWNVFCCDIREGVSALLQTLDGYDIIC